MKYLIYIILVFSYLALYSRLIKPLRAKLKAIALTIVFVFTILPDPIMIGGTIILGSKGLVMFLAGIETIDAWVEFHEKYRASRKKKDTVRRKPPISE